MTALGRTLHAWDNTVEVLLRQVSNALAAESHHTLVLRFTLVLIILHGATSPFSAVVVRVLGLLMLVLPTLTRCVVPWSMMAVTLAASNADQWELIDNHQYLMTYWVIVCALTVSTDRALRSNARLLIAIAFSFAVLWKFVAGQYLDGGFFQFTLLQDGRLQNIAGVLVDDGVGGVKQTSAAIRQLALHGQHGSTLEIVIDRTLLAPVALLMSWGGLALESLVAVLHILPHTKWYAARHVALMMFVAFTYPLLPVTGFGFLLSVMGFAQVRADDERMKQCYLALLCFLQITLIPWRNLLAD